jgi:hypothetical protein
MTCEASIVEEVLTVLTVGRDLSGRSRTSMKLVGEPQEIVAPRLIRLGLQLQF